MEFKFKPGDRVEIIGCPGYTGIVQICTMTHAWLDCSPGAANIGGEWVYAHFPLSWEPNESTWHYINVIELDLIIPYEESPDIDPIKIDAGNWEVIFNSLYEDPHINELRREIFWAKSPQGDGIGVNWLPEFDRQGKYHIVKTNESGTDVENLGETSKLEEVAIFVEAFIKSNGGPSLCR